MKVVLLIFILVSSGLHAQETSPAEIQPIPPSETGKIYPDMPEFHEIQQWMNSPPLTKSSLKGKVVLVDFWTYTCINCIRTLPVLKDWHRKYKTQGLVIVGVHSPEFDFEKDPANVKMAVEKYRIPYPIAMDNRMATWSAYDNQYWPAHYFIDAQGKIRHTHFGEGEYEKSEEVIRRLLAEVRPKKSETAPTTQPVVAPPATVDFSQIRSPETYLGFLRRERLITSGRPLELNEWSYEGNWQPGRESMTLKDGTGKIRFRFSATKVNLVLHPGPTPGKVVIRLDEQIVPREKVGRDVKDGRGVEVTEPRLYELINLGPRGEEHTIEIEFLTPGTSAYAFTFG